MGKIILVKKEDDSPPIEVEISDADYGEARARGLRYHFYQGMRDGNLAQIIDNYFQDKKARGWGGKPRYNDSPKRASTLSALSAHVATGVGLNFLLGGPVGYIIAGAGTAALAAAVQPIARQINKTRKDWEKAYDADYDTDFPEKTIKACVTPSEALGAQTRGKLIAFFAPLAAAMTVVGVPAGLQTVAQGIEFLQNDGKPVPKKIEAKPIEVKSIVIENSDLSETEQRYSRLSDQPIGSYELDQGYRYDPGKNIPGFKYGRLIIKVGQRDVKKPMPEAPRFQQTSRQSDFIAITLDKVILTPNGIQIKYQGSCNVTLPIRNDDNEPMENKIPVDGWIKPIPLRAGSGYAAGQMLSLPPMAINPNDQQAMDEISSPACNISASSKFGVATAEAFKPTFSADSFSKRYVPKLPVGYQYKFEKSGPSPLPF